MLSKGADPNRPGQWQAGVTEYPLHRAADGNMVRLLLRHHAKVDVTDSAGMTPLHRVAGAGDEDAAFYLLKAMRRSTCATARAALPWTWP